MSKNSIHSYLWGGFGLGSQPCDAVIRVIWVSWLIVPTTMLNTQSKSSWHQKSTYRQRRPMKLDIAKVHTRGPLCKQQILLSHKWVASKIRLKGFMTKEMSGKMDHFEFWCPKNLIWKKGKKHYMHHCACAQWSKVARLVFFPVELSTSLPIL